MAQVGRGNKDGESHDVTGKQDLHTGIIFFENDSSTVDTKYNT